MPRHRLPFAAPPASAGLASLVAPKPPVPLPSPNRRARRAAFRRHEKAARKGQAAVLDVRFGAQLDQIVMSIEESTGITRHHVLSADAVAIIADRAARACAEWDAAHAPAPDPEPGSAGAELLAQATANVGASPNNRATGQTILNGALARAKESCAGD